ncbi:unnamed protein product [Effrenium voratum]|uniref:RING-type domain-containing protein n=1 Tax=Effrenium voratum TaxID=2562239 RepID=A0AA36J0W3_9DINO|nr:unnamed protein product [Effrenium voratum]
MGCGVSQRAVVEEVQRREAPRPVREAARPAEASEVRSRRRGDSRSNSGERQARPRRVEGRPQNVQDHAFCFECGIFFCVGSAQVPQCSQCGSSFVQFLRAAQDSNWITTDNPIAQNFAFDDQLENSISASLAETPIPKKPTQKSFLQSLQTTQLDKAEVEVRSRLGPSDPRSNCSICRDTFVVGDGVHKLPCNHEFHAGCILLWLKGSNTCPICRLQLPEAQDGEEEISLSKSCSSPNGHEESEKEVQSPRSDDEAGAPPSGSAAEAESETGEGDGKAGPDGDETVGPCTLPGALEDLEEECRDSEGAKAESPS